MSKKVLLLCYYYPPSASVGGRRWAKLTKELSKNGFEFHIFCKETELNGNDGWYDDIKDNKNLTIHPKEFRRHKVRLFFHKHQFINNLFADIFYFLEDIFLDNNYDDMSYDMGESFEFLEDIILKENIDTIVATGSAGADINNLILASKLKQKYNHLKLISDIRDTFYLFYFGDLLSNYKTIKKSARKEIEDFFIESSDFVVNVTKEATNLYANHFLEYKDKFVTIYNFYDKSDIKNIEIKKPNNMHIIYAGSSYYIKNSMSKILDVFMEMDDEVISANMKFIFYTDKSDFIEERHKHLVGKSVEINSIVSKDEIFEKINECKFGYCPNLTSLVSGTKIYDYMVMERNIIIYKEDGSLDNNKFGDTIVMNDENIRESLIYIKDLYLKNEYLDYKEMGIYSLEENAKKYIEILES